MAALNILMEFREHVALIEIHRIGDGAIRLVTADGALIVALVALLVATLNHEPAVSGANRRGSRPADAFIRAVVGGFEYSAVGPAVLDQVFGIQRPDIDHAAECPGSIAARIRALGNVESGNAVEVIGIDAALGVVAGVGEPRLADAVEKGENPVVAETAQIDAVRGCVVVHTGIDAAGKVFEGEDLSLVQRLAVGCLGERRGICGFPFSLYADGFQCGSSAGASFLGECADGLTGKKREGAAAREDETPI